MTRSKPSSVHLVLALVAMIWAGLPGCGDDDGEPRPDVGTVETFAELGATSEGIAFGVDSDGVPVLYVGADNAIQRVAPDGTVTRLVDLPSPLGMALQEDGSLIVCGKAEGAAGEGELPGVLWRVEPEGTKSELVGPDKGPFGQTNYVAVATDGSLVFTDSVGDGVYAASADGQTVELLTSAITYPNGLAFSPDGSTLYVASWDSDQLWSLPFLDPGYGAPEVFYDGINTLDGLVTLADGALIFVSTLEGIVRFDLAGTKTVLADLTDFLICANGAFGVGPYGTEWLYVTDLGSTTLDRVFVGEPGLELP